ncbi:MAG TPA: hypothetical protein VMG08_10915 [Allosphingosinicella sp.]|nr:hypothetical protein [Allosphingosinicella sp.]
MTDSGVPDGAPDVRVAWRRDDEGIEADAIAFWARLSLLPEGVDPAVRAKEIVAGAYRDGELVGLATAAIEHVTFLKATMAVLRAATAPDHRRTGVQRALAGPVHAALSDWAAANAEVGLAGIIGFVDASELGDFLRVPVWPASGLEVIGYTPENRQIRVRWFDHFRFD